MSPPSFDGVTRDSSYDLKFTPVKLRGDTRKVEHANMHQHMQIRNIVSGCGAAMKRSGCAMLIQGVVFKIVILAAVWHGSSKESERLGICVWSISEGGLLSNVHLVVLVVLVVF